MDGVFCEVQNRPLARGILTCFATKYAIEKLGLGVEIWMPNLKGLPGNSVQRPFSTYY